MLLKSNYTKDLCQAREFVIFSNSMMCKLTINGIVKNPNYIVVQFLRIYLHKSLVVLYEVPL